MTGTSGDIGSILGVWAHPDDEAYLSAGLMAATVAAGHRVVCVTATRGEAGFPPGDPRSAPERVAIREEEIAACLGILGVTEHHWLGYPDGGCAAIPDDEAAAAVGAIVDEMRPDAVLTFGPDGGTGHLDHLAAFRWATLACGRVRRPGPRLLYATKTPDWIRRFRGPDSARYMMVEDFESDTADEDALAVRYRCADVILARKVTALRAQASQVEPVVALFGIDGYREFVRDEFFRDPRPGDWEVMRRTAGLPPRAG